MPDAKALAGATRLKQTIRALRDQWLSPRRPGATRSGSDSRSVISHRWTRPSIRRSTACRPWPRYLNGFAAIVPTGVSYCDHHDHRPTYSTRTRNPRRRAGRRALRARDPQCASARSLRQIQSLVAERAVVEAKVQGERSFERPRRPIPNIATARAALAEKLEKLDREARAADEKQRRSIIDAAMQGEASAKAEFAAASRKIATMFDAARDTVKTDYGTGKAEAAQAHDSAQKKAARQNAEKSKPIEDSAHLADSIRERLAFLAAEYRKFGLDPDPPAAVSESYEKFDDPGDELFTRLARMDQPLRLLEGLIIPKSMKGGREAWVFILLMSIFGGLGFWLAGGHHRPRRRCRARGRPRFPAAHVARQALQDPARAALHAAHAGAGRRRRARRLSAAYRSLPSSRKNASESSPAATKT